MRKKINLLSQKSDQKGFTLIELLVVIAIVGTLMALGVSNYLSYRAAGADQAEMAAATDFLTLALAQISQSGGAQFGENQGLPNGFVIDQSASSPYTIAGDISLSAAGLVTDGSVTFTHSGGTATDAVINAGAGNNPQVVAQ